MWLKKTYEGLIPSIKEAKIRKKIKKKEKSNRYPKEKSKAKWDDTTSLSKDERNYW